jgi:hypothetical integral membrane protein (TIGR02206 family)
MSRYFAREYSGGAFVLLGPSHLVTLGITVAAILGLFFWGRSLPARAKLVVRTGLAGLLISNEIAWHAWTIATDQWSVRTMLPLHMCSVTTWLSILGLLRPNLVTYEFVYFLGITGAGHTVATPDIGIYGFPHLRFFLTLVGHAAIVVTGAYLTFAEGYRPTWASIRRVLVWTNVYLVAIFFLNKAIGSNYMYVAHKPATASLMDVLGPWPWYILALEAVGVLHMLALYAPFAIADARQRWKTAAAGQDSTPGG